MKKVFIKLLVIAACAIAVLAFCTSCAGNSYDGTATAYLNAFVRFDYEKMYEMLTPGAQGRVTYDKFVEYHKKVYDVLKVRSVTVERGACTDNGLSQTYDYTANFISEEYGTFSYDMQLEVYKKAKFYLVSWTPANVVGGMDWNDRIYAVTTHGKRGEIFDRDGRVIVQNDYAATVYADKESVKDSLDSTCVQVAQVIGAEAMKLRESFNKSSGNTGIFATMFRNKLSLEQEEALESIPNVKVDRSSITPIRYYPYGDALAQTLGYSTPITPEDREKAEYKYLDEGTRIGRSGLEGAYDLSLQPTNGYRIYLLSDDSKRKTVLYEQPAKDGYDLMLTVDIAIEKDITDYMKENYKDISTGTANIIDPQTGAAVALVSYPSYDANVYAFDKATDYGDLFENANTPLLNRNVQGTYPPGSIFKSLMACIGISTNTVDPYSRFPYENEIQYYTYEKDRWRPAGSKWSTYIVRQAFRGSASGPLDMHRALTWSDNIYFGWLAMQVGKEKMIQYAEKIGIGESIPFDLKVKKSQLANSMDTLNSVKLLADTGFGQAEVLFTPLQLCCSFSLFGNNGSIMQPYIVKCICDTNEKGEHVIVKETTPTVYKSEIFTPTVVSTVRSILENTAANGTGKSGTRDLLSTMRIASKTGTAQTGTNDTGEVGWYAGLVIDGGEKDAVLISADESDLKFACVRHVFTLLRDEILSS